MLSDKGKAPASHAHESVQVTSESKCASVEEETTENVRVICAHVGKRSTLKSDVIFKSSNRARTWESDEPKSLVSGSVAEQIVHTNWKTKTDSETNLVISTIKQQVLPGLLRLSQPGASSTSIEALNCLDVKPSLSASLGQNFGKVVARGLS